MNIRKISFLNIAKRAFAIIMIISMVFYSIPFDGFTEIAKADGSQFNINLSSIGATWVASDATISGGQISTTTNGQALIAILIDDEDLQSAIDLGTVSVSSSLNVTVEGLVQDPPPANLHKTTFKIRFGSSVSAAYSAAPAGTDSRESAADESFSLGAGAAIPAGTRCIIMEGSVLTYQEASAGIVTTTFTSSTTRIPDSTNPTITPTYNTGWTNQDILVTITAADGIGVKGIYAGDDTLLTSDSTYTYTITDEGDNLSSFYAKDFAGNISDTIDVNVNNIDKTPPSDIQAPTVNNTSWTNESVTVTFPSITQPTNASPETYMFSSDGSAFSPFSGNVHTVLQEGEYTWTYRTDDEAGNLSSNTVTATTRYDVTAPVIDSIVPTRTSGENKYTITVSDAHSGVAAVKYASGTQDASYFDAGGTELTAPYEIVSTVNQGYTVYVKDVAGNTTVQTIAAQNILPALSAISDVTIDEDTPTTIEIAASDDTTALADLAITAASSDTSVLANTTGYHDSGKLYLDINPVADANTDGSSISITVNCEDGDGESVSTSFNLTVTPVNDEPTANADSGGTGQNTDVAIDVLSNDTDVENDTLTIQSYTQGANGSVTEDASHNLVYSPDTDWAGTDTFTYTISDGNLTSQATVTVTVSNVNDAPVARDDTATTNEDTLVQINVTSNDSDPDIGVDPAETLAVAIDPSNQPNLGSVTITNNVINYTPNANVHGTDTFVYILTDAQGATDTAIVTVTIDSVNDVPVISNAPTSISVNEDSVNNTFTFDVLDTETGLESLMVQVVSTDKTLVKSDSISVALNTATGECAVTFTPAANSNGSLNIKLLLSDGIVTVEQLVPTTIVPGNDAPVAVDDNMTDEWRIIEDIAKSLDLSVLTDNDSDVDGNPLTVTGVSSVSSGSLVKTSGQTYTYTPALNYNGNVEFTYTISDGEGETDTAKVTFEVIKKDDAPELTLDGNNEYTCEEDNFVKPLLITVSDIDTDLEDLIVTVESVNETLMSSDNIAITNNLDGTYSISLGLTEHENGSTDLVIYLSDGINTVTETVTYTVTPMQDAPVALDDEYTVDRASVTYIIPISNDFDYDDEPLDLLNSTSFTQPAEGVLTLKDRGFLYRAPGNTTGTYTFTYTITDGIDQATATVTLNVVETGEIDGPIISEIADISVMENTSIGSISFTVEDDDGVDTVVAVSSDQSIVADGSITISHTGINYTMGMTLLPNVTGVTDITITATDDNGHSSIRQFAVNVYPENETPIANDDTLPLGGATVLAYEDTVYSFTAADLLANDTDAENDALSVIFVSDPIGHSYITGNGTDYELHPSSNRNGDITFTYYITDGYTTSSPATVTVYLIPVNDRPDGDNDYYTLANDIGSEVLNISASGVLANDDDVDGDTLSVDRVGTQPQYGEVTLNADGSFTYTRDQIAPGTYGADSFTYYVTDGDLVETSPTTVYIRTHYEPDFYIYYRSATCYEDDPQFSISIPIGEGNGYTGTYEVTSITNLDLGTAVAGPGSGTNLSILFTPNPGVYGGDTFTYEVTDTDTGRSKTANIYVYIIPVNDAPTFVIPPDSPWTENEDGSKTFNIQVADADHDVSDLEIEVYLTNQSNSNPVALDGDITLVRDTGDLSKATVTVPFLPNRHGTFSVVFNVSDGIDSTTFTSDGTVVPVDDPPNAPDKSVTLKEDTSISVEIMDDVTDIDTAKSDLTLSITTGASNGTATISGDEIVYYPDYNFYGTDTVTYRVATSADPSVYSEGEITFTVEPENDDPYVYDIDYYVVTDEDTTCQVNFMSFDYEDDESTSDANETTYSLTTDNPAVIPLSGISMEVDSGDPNHKILTLVPEANMFGVVNLTVTATDSHGATTTLDFIVNVVSVNDFPDAVDDTAVVDEDSSVEITVLANDSDIEDDVSTTDDLELSVIEVSDCTNGKTVINSHTGVITYIPDVNFNGADSFTYTLSDSFGDTKVATVNVTINPVNDPPVAEDDEGNALEGQTITIDLLDNDWDIEIQRGETTDELEIVSISPSIQGGTISFANGILTYTASDDLSNNVVDTFTYIIKDSPTSTDTDEGTITINVEQVNDPPAAENDVSNTIEIGTGTWIFDEDTTGVFIVDIADAETYANQLLVSISSDGQALVADSNITMANTATYDKQITLVPFANVFGEFNITFKVSDGEIETTAVFPVKILPVNDLPVLTVHDLSMMEEETDDDTATATDVETASGDFEFSVSAQASNGTASINPVTGEYTYTPNVNFTGSDSFEITVTDEDGGTDTETVNVEVSPVNDAPIATDDSYTIAENAAEDFYVLVNDTDVDTVYGDSLTIASVVQPDHGTVTIVGDHLHYVPEAYNNNSVTFTYTIEDEGSATSTATVNVDITPYNNEPANGDDTYTIDEDAQLTSFDVLVNDDVDTDPELNSVITDTLTLLSVTPNTPANSEVCEIAIVGGKQVLNYKPALNFHGTDVVTYTMKDANAPAGTEYTFTATITVNSINDLPTISDVANFIGTEDNNLLTSTTISDIETDVDNLVVTATWDNDMLIDSVNISTTGTTRTVDVVPKTNMSGVAIITLKVEDEHGGENIDTFTVTFNPVNDLSNPIIGLDTATTDENTTVYIDVLGNDDVDTNLEGDELFIVPGSISLSSATDYGGTYSIVQRTVQRTRLNSDGTTTTVDVTRDVIEYIPNPDWTESTNQVQVFSYQMYEVSDPTTIYDAADKVEITITPVNDAPTIDIDLAGDVISMDEDAAGGTGSIDVVVNDEEDGNGTLTVEVESITEHEPNSLPTSPLVLPSDVVINTTADDSIRELVITSQENESGVFDVELKITDSNGSVSYDTVTVTVNPVQDPPSDGDDLFTTSEDTPINLDVLENDDVDTSTQGSESTLLSVVSQPANGTAVKSGNNIIYTPDLDYFNDSAGPGVDDTFQYLMEDGNGAQATFTVTMYVTPVNDAPVLDFDDDEAPDDNKVTTPESTQRVIKLYVSDVDDIDADLQMTGSSSNPLIVNDATGGISIGSLQTDSGGSYFEVTLTPYGKWNGVTDLTFIASDPTTRGSGTDEAQSIQVVQLEITPVNDAPDAIADSLSGNEGNTIFLNVLSNDTDPDFETNPDGDELSIIIADFAAGETNSHVGTVSINSAKDRIIFTPAVGFEDWNGVLDIEYTISDLEGLTDTVVSQLTINQVNDDPVANADTGTSNEDSYVDINIISNDTDIDMDGSLNNMPYTEFLSIKSDGFADLDNGTVSIVNSTTIRYTPEDNFNGEEVFTYTLLDNNGGSATGTVTVTVTPVDDNPTAVNDTASTDEDNAVTINVLSNDSDTDSNVSLNLGAGANDGVLEITHVDGNAISVGSPVTVANGEVSLDESGSEDRLVFTPNAEFNGTQTFEYTISNNDNNTATAEVTVTVNSVNDAPIAVNDSATTAEDSPVTFNIISNDSDVDIATAGDSISIAEVDIVGETYGTVSILNGVLTYTPNANFNGTETMTYTLRDTQGGTDTATITITVTPVDDNPTAVDDTTSTDEDNAVTINVLSNDSDTDSDTLLNLGAGANNGVLEITEVNGTPISVGSPVTVANGTVSLDESGSEDVLVFTPNAEYNGTQTFEYTVSNNDGNTATAEVEVTVNSINDAPIAVNDSATTDEDNSVTFNIIANDSDVDIATAGDSISIAEVDIVGETYGTVSILNGVLTYTPNADFNGTETMTYTLRDTNGGTDTATITITVTPVDDNPTAVDDTTSIDEDNPVTINVLSNDSDTDSDVSLNLGAGANDGVLEITHVDGNAISVGSPVTVANGTVSLDESGSEDVLVFTPNAEFNGSQTFEYTISNNDNNTATAEVTVTVNSVNDAPIAVNDSATTDEDNPVTFNIIANDSDVDIATAGDSISIAEADIVGETYGTVSITNGVLTYTPNADFNGTETMTYTLRDTQGGTDTATITITVTPVDDNPTAVDDTTSTDEDNAVTINVLSNDSDTDSDTLLNLGAGANNGVLEITEVNGTPISVGSPVAVANGEVSLDESGSEDRLVFTPNAEFNGTQTFEYTVANNDGNTATAEVEVTVNSINDAPIAVDDITTTAEDSPVTFNIISNDSDVDIATAGDSISIAEVDIVGETYGTVSILNGVLTYTPNANFNGTETMTYTLRDTNGGTDTATITITVTPVDDNPTAVNDTTSTDEDNAVTINVLANDSDTDSDVSLNLGAGANDGVLEITHVDGNPISAGSPVAVANGEVSLDENGSEDRLVFTPNAEYNGTQTFEYTVSNNDGNTATAEVEVTVNSINDAPIAVDDITTTAEDSPVTFNIISNDSDVDIATAGDSISIAEVDIVGETYGTVSILNGVLTYTPNANFNGTETMTYTLRDTNGGTDTATITITVTPVGDAPVLSTESYTVDEDEYTASQATQWYNMDVLANDTDIDETTNSAFEDLKITNISFTEDNVRLVTASDQKSINFQSDEDWNGVVSFTYTVTDAYNISRSMTSQITVNQVNDAPVAGVDVAATNEDTPITFSIIGNDSDVDTNVDLNANPSDDSITINESDVLGVAHGSISLTNGMLTYTPDANFNGVENLTYTLLDEHGGMDTTTITITVNQVFDNPRASDDGVSLDEDDTFKDIYPLVNDYNPDSDASFNAVPDTRALQIQSIDLSTMPAGAGTITNEGGYLHYVPNPHYEGTFKIEYTCVNGNGGTDTAEITIYVAQVYDDPVGDDITPSMNEDTTYTVDLDNYISDVDAGTTFTLSIVTNGTHGSASINPTTHVLTYTPDANFNGTDTIVYMVEDNQLLSDTGTINITINQVNDTPVTLDDTASSSEDVAVTINVIANDSDIDTDVSLNANPSAEKITVKADGFSDVDNGTVTVLSNNTSILFTPDAHWHGTKVFKYTCVDVTGAEVEAEVTVTIDPVNDTPVFKNYTKTLDEDSSITYYASSLVFDPDIASIGDSITFTIVTKPANGTLVIENDNKIIYTPDTNFNGDDVFTIKVEDSVGETVVETFNMVVAQVNDTPKAKNDSVSTLEDTSVVIDVLANDSDIDMNRTLNKYPSKEDIEIYIEKLGTPSHGSVSVDPNDNTKLIYVPDENFHGVDRFECTIVDNSGAKSTAYVEITVESVADVPELIQFTTPYAGNKYLSGHRLGTGWSVHNPDNIDLSYTLSFFDGDKWIVIGENLTAEEYEHIINDYITETDSAQFRVFGVMPDGTETNTIYSDVFIVDNVAPVNTKYTVTPVDGFLFPSITIEVDYGEDLIEFYYLYSVGSEGERIVIENNQFIMGSENEDIYIYAKDELGNTALVDKVALGRLRGKPNRREIAGGISILFGLFIIIFLLWYRNIKVVFTYEDGKTKTVKYFRRHNDKGIDVKLKEKLFEGAVSVDMTMKKRITQKMLGFIVNVSKGDSLLKKVVLPESFEGKYEDRIM